MCCVDCCAPKIFQNISNSAISYFLPEREHQNDREKGVGYLYLNFFHLFFSGRNPNVPYEVAQLFGAGNQLDGIKQWDSYEVESQKYLQIGRAIIQFPVG